MWAESKRIAALRSYALLGNLAAVSREQGVPKSTVARWVRGNPDRIEEFRAEYMQACSEGCAEEISAFKDRVLPKIEKAIETILGGIEDWRLSFASLRDKAYAAKQLFEIHQLLEGGPTMRGEITFWDRIKDLMEEEEE